MQAQIPTGSSRRLGKCRRRRRRSQGINKIIWFVHALQDCYTFNAVGVTQCWIRFVIQGLRGAIPRTSTVLRIIHSE